MNRGQYLATAIAPFVLGLAVTPAVAVGRSIPKYPLQKASIGPMSVRSLEGRARLASQGADLSKPDVPLAWTNTASMPAGAGVIRFAHAQCANSPNSFYVISGVDEGFSVAAASWRYDADTDTWNPLAASPSPQEGGMATCQGNFIYYAAGGGTNGFFIYDVAANTWAPGPVVPRLVWGAAMGSTAGSVFLIGGDSDFSFGGTSNVVNIYDIASNTWTGTGTAMPNPIVASGWAQVNDDVYIVGGWNDSSPGANANTTLRYSMSTDTWTTGPTFTTSRSDLALGATSVNLYAIGGDANGGGAFDPSNTVEVLPTATFPGGAWTDAGDPLPQARTAVNAGFCTNFVSGGEVWALDGVVNPFPTFFKVTQFKTAEPCPASGPPAPLIATAGSTLTVEGCSPGNGAIDPDEIVTVTFGFRNVGTLDTVDMVATLQATGGVTPLTTSQDYGVLTAGGPAVTRPFQFAAAGACGGTLTASFDLVDGSLNLGTKTFTFTLGSAIVSGPNTFSNPTAITINDGAPATPYPSDIVVAGLTGNISKVTATITGFTHTFPADVDILLVSPTGQSVLLEGGAGGGDDIVGINLTYDDSGPPLPAILVSGTFHPTDVFHTPLEPPAPGEPYGGAMAAFNGVDANGTWHLFVHDHAGADIGVISGGWSIDITTSIPDCCLGPQGQVSIGDVTVTEGNSGTVDALFPVTLNPAGGSTVSVDFNTQDGTATVADSDYAPLTGTVVFAPGETLHMITISVIGDVNFEADENFFVSLSNPIGTSILDGLGEGTILNDDKPLAASTRDELIHDSRETRDLDTISRFWRISQKAHSSYEVVIDAVTGDIGIDGPDLLRLASDGTTVLDTGTSTTGGTSKSLHFENAGATDNNAEFIRVRSAGCVADCDSTDTVRIRAYDTTYRIARFNNSSTQITVLVIANPTDQVVNGTLWFYSASTGNLLTSQAVMIAAHGTFVLNTSNLPPLQGQAGSATFSNDSPFGALTGKAVAVEPATGFTFDTAMVARTASTKMVPRDN